MESIASQIKKIGFIDTNVGRFEYKGVIGEGGNSNVFLFSRSGHDFAIKILKQNEDEQKIKRFKDEFFCVSQMPSHKNIVKYYHLDKVVVNDAEYFIIVMKPYEKTIKKEFAIQDSAEEYRDGMKRLFFSLYNGIKHIHDNEVIHRDIKPENIFYDKDMDAYVIGDFGISKFDDLLYARSSETRDGERLANYKFSAPEQSSGAFDVSKASDIYSLGQVLQYFGTGDVSKGTGRKPLLYTDDFEFISILDKVIEKCIMHDPHKRFSNLDEIKYFCENESERAKERNRAIERRQEESRNWGFLYEFEREIVKAVPSIDGVERVTSERDISIFLSGINSIIKPDGMEGYLWMVESTGADLNYHGSELNKGRYYNVMYGSSLHEISIDAINAYYDRYHPYKNFFIVFTNGMDPFAFCDLNDVSKIKSRGSVSSLIDFAIKWRGYHLDPDDVKNQYVKIEGVTYEVNRNEFEHVYRFINKNAFLIVPKGTPSTHMHDRAVATDLISACVSNHGFLKEADVETYLSRIRHHYQEWIVNAL